MNAEKREKKYLRYQSNEPSLMMRNLVQMTFDFQRNLSLVDF